MKLQKIELDYHCGFKIYHSGFKIDFYLEKLQKGTEIA